MGPSTDFWNGRRVLITGHTGFKGSWLLLWLSELGCEVSGYALSPPTEPNLFEASRAIDALSTNFHSDIRTSGGLRAAIERCAPEIIFHLAAQSLVRASYEDPVYTYDTNVMGTLHLLEAARLSPSVRAVVIVTSDKCYENTERVASYSEDDELGGRDPYSNSKACAELLVASYRASFLSSQQERLRVATARAGNVIGGGDWSEDRLIPDCVRAFSQHQPVTLRYPNAVRPWQHVLDPLSGYLMLAERLVGSRGFEFAIPWNFGPDPTSEVTVLEVARSVARLWGDKCEVHVNASDTNLHEAGVLRLNSERARSKLGWRPQWTLEQSLRETTAWYRAWQSGRDMNRYSRDQILAFGRTS